MNKNLMPFGEKAYYLKIRYVLPEDDLQEISNVYEQSWKYAYKDIIPKSWLDSIPTGTWADNINRNGRKNIVMLEKDSIIGTLSFCKSRWERYSHYGEIVSIYLLPQYIGKGYGKALLDKAVGELKLLGLKYILLWCLRIITEQEIFMKDTVLFSMGNIKTIGLAEKN